MAGFEVGELPGAGVGGEGREPPAVSVCERELRSGMGPFTAHDHPHSVGPAGCGEIAEHPGQFGDVRTRPGLVVVPFIHTRPKYSAQIVGALLYRIGEDRIQFPSDSALRTPKRLVESFVDFHIPADLPTPARSPAPPSETNVRRALDVVTDPDPELDEPVTTPRPTSPT